MFALLLILAIVAVVFFNHMAFYVAGAIIGLLILVIAALVKKHRS